ncbi:MAG: SDR family NAD(P)-dependent oxidoreductase, partial [Alkalispirochaeta sp.]
LGNSVAGRVAIVTGAAQGFGLEIARGLAALGAVVVLADMNIDGARKQAAHLGDPHRAFAVNVTDEESVAALVEGVTREYGGFDLVVSNAGVLKAGSVKDLGLSDFRFVTDVNYIGFFLMTKHSAPVLELQNRGAVALQGVATAGGATGGHRSDPTEGDDASVGGDLDGTSSAGPPPSPAVAPRPVPYLTDIVEINSKSGLVGSNRNAAYAGSKFGGIGLVQSFALELVEQGMKVNAICPGNYLDGPLWSDPERGLFVQYLRAGKVPGATTVEEVRRFYEDKVPMRRGCTGSDVVRAVAYVVGQPYETGQAVPVTGGQVMLS